MSISSFGMGFFVGYGAGFFTREALPFAREVLSPISRVTMRSAVKVFEGSREAFSRVGEAMEDIYAEVRQEMKKEKVKKKKVRPKPSVVTEVERSA